ncbi:MAG: HEAT repeat domain-containing protein [Pseudanabaenaceae cyanobacterium]
MTSDRPASSAALVSTAANDGLLQTVTERLAEDRLDPTTEEGQALVVRLVNEGLGDERGVVRLRFAETLREIGEAATPHLTQALRTHPNPVVRRAAAKTLTLIADPQAVPDLLHAFLHDPDTVVHGSAAGALARTGEAAVPALLQVLADTSLPETTKGHAAWALSFIGAEAADLLYQALDQTQEESARCALIAAIGQVARERGDQAAIDLLRQTLTDPRPALRAEAAASLGELAIAPEPLYPLLADDDLDVRKATVSALGKLGTPATIPHLQPLLTHPTPALRVLAKRAIAQIEERQAQSNA